MKGVVVDTNIVIDVVNGRLNPDNIALSSAVISAITVAELYALAGMGIEEERQIDLAVSFFDVVPLNAAIARRAGLLARTRAKDKSDLLIAATALHLGFLLLTRNIRDFRTVPGLQLLQPNFR